MRRTLLATPPHPRPSSLLPHPLPPAFSSAAHPPTRYLAQWAHVARARSQYSDAAGAAAAALGPPDATRCGGAGGVRGGQDARSWMPAVGTSVPDWLEVRFLVPVRVWRWHVYMSAQPEALRRVELLDTTGAAFDAPFEPLPPPLGTGGGSDRCPCGGTAEEGCSVIISGELPGVSQQHFHQGLGHTAGLRLHTAGEGWEAVDAVELEGFAETQQCRLGGGSSSLLLETETVLVCAAPPYYSVPPQSQPPGTRNRTAAAAAASGEEAFGLRSTAAQITPAGSGVVGAADAASGRLGAGGGVAATVPVELALNGADGTLLALTGAAEGYEVRYTYYAPPRLAPPLPSAALAAGGTRVTLAGDGFGFGDTNTTKCRFGAEQLVAAVEASRDGVVCEAPPAARLGPAAVQLTLNDQDYMEAGEVFYYSVSLHAVRPSGGPAGGGALVTITGAGFDTVRPLGAAAPNLHQALCRFSFAPPSNASVAPVAAGASSYIAGGADGLGTPWPDAWSVTVPVLSRDASALRCVAPTPPDGFVGIATVSVTLNAQARTCPDLPPDLPLLSPCSQPDLPLISAGLREHARAALPLLHARALEPHAGGRPRARRHDRRRPGRGPRHLRRARLDALPLRLARARARRQPRRARHRLPGPRRVLAPRHHRIALHGGRRRARAAARAHARARGRRRRDA